MNRYFFVTDTVAQSDLEVEKCPVERMWAYILTNPLQVRAFSEFKAELMKLPVDYEDKITYKNVVNTTEVSDTNVVQIGNSNDRYRSYAKASRPTTKPSLDSTQECVEVT